MNGRGHRLAPLRALLAGAAVAGVLRRNPLLALAGGGLLHWTYLLPALWRNCGWNGPVVRRFETDRPEVWLTIDDGPEATAAYLEILGRFDALATFFVIGAKVDARRDAARAIVDAGHGIENHSYSHPVATFWAQAECCILSEMRRCSHAIRAATGREPALFRAPVGMVNGAVHPAAAASWLRVCGWSADAADGRPGNHPVRALRRLGARARPGDILLVHEAPGRQRAEALAALLEELRERGLRCVIPAAKQLRAA